MDGIRGIGGEAAIKDYHRATLIAGKRRVKHPDYGDLPREI
jgi:hypothetical protein